MQLRRLTNILKMNRSWIQYEELCSNPIPVFMKVAEFCEIEWNEHFEDRLKNHKLRNNTNNKFKRELSLQATEGVGQCFRWSFEEIWISMSYHYLKEKEKLRSVSESWEI